MNFEKLTTKFQQSANNSNILILLISLPIIYYFYLVNFFAVNIPYQDDYGTIIRFMNEYFEPTADKLSLLFSQTGNEHRLAFNRFVVLALYGLYGEVNFKFLIIIGNVALLLLFIMLFKVSKLHSKTTVFIFGAFLLFQPEHWESMTWAMAALSNYYVLLFALLSIYCLQWKNNTGFYLSILLAIIATYTNGNGLFVLYINLLSLIIDRTYFSKTKISSQYLSFHFAIYLILTILVTGLYFLNYTKTGHHQTIENILVIPLFFLKHFLLMLGSGFAFELSNLGIFVGVIILLSFGWLSYCQYFRHHPTLFYFILFIIISVLIASITRAGFGVLDQALSSRYRIYSILLILLLGLATIEQLEINYTIKNYFLWIIIGLSVMFNLYSVQKNTAFLIQHQAFLTTSIRHFALQEYSEFTAVTHAKNPERAINNLKSAINRGYYKIPKYYTERTH